MGMYTLHMYIVNKVHNFCTLYVYNNNDLNLFDNHSVLYICSSKLYNLIEGGKWEFQQYTLHIN